MKTKLYLKSFIGMSALVLGMISAKAQVLSFTNSNSKLPNNAVNYRSGNSVSVADVNNDGLDDIIRLDQSNDINLEIQNINGGYTSYFLGSFTGGNAWAMTVADLDKNGIKDVIAGMGSTGSIALINYSGGNYTANISVLQASNFFWQNISVGDFNNDGWQDIFGCDDVNWSKLYINNGNGTFRRMANAVQTLTIGTGTVNLTVQSGLTFAAGQSVYITYNSENYMQGTVVSYSGTTLVVNVTSTVGSGSFGGWSVDQNTVINFITNPGTWGSTGDPNNSGNYGTVWTDFDSDGDMDFYIAKCRQSSSDPNDLRRIDQLFINDGTYKFKEDAAARGVANGWQTWTASFGDIDNDGDFDIAAINNDHTSQIFENDGTGHYTELTTANISTSGIYPLESQFEDFDNDGFIDLIVTGDDDYIYYKNNGDKTFTRIYSLLSANGVMSFATGDLNHDGFIDIYASLGDIYNNPSGTYDDIMYLNDGNTTNHFITFDLEGTVSNNDAIGTNVVIYGPWGIQRREVRSGESYGTCNSSMLHFGLGINLNVDSATITWPSGIVQHLYNLEADQFVKIIENGCLITGNTIGGPHAICNGQSTTLTAASGFSSYLWSNGSTSSSITTSTVDTYAVIVTDANGCSSISPSITLAINPVEIPTIQAVGETTFCQGNSITLTSSTGSSYTWSNGANTQSVSITQSGSYFVSVMGTCQVYTSDTIDVNVFPAPAPSATGGSVTNSGSVTLTASGNSLTWYDDVAGTNVVGTGPLFNTPTISSTTTYYVQDTYTYGGGIEYAGAHHHTGTSLWSGNTTNASLIFDAYEDFTLKTVKVYTDTPGDRLVVLTDASNNVLQSLMVNIPMDSSIITLNFAIPAGTGYKIGTDAAQNTTLWGNPSPRLKRTQGASVAYPYVINNLVSITNSTQGLNVYYYFYNWEIEKTSTICTSALTPVVAEVIITGLNHISNNSNIHLFPNPASDKLSITFDKSMNNNVSVNIVDVAGRIAQTNSFVNISAQSQQHIDISKLAKGVYFVKINTADEEYIEKLLVK
ncbi:MAG TPA: FG-GAP-like repeat-containing protein [Bacteroidia bacterium]|nr:FG-GAP-like repeat-containing protein [Bacteroidia bacterium]